MLQRQTDANFFKRMQIFFNGWANRFNVLPKALNGCKFFPTDKQTA